MAAKKLAKDVILVPSNVTERHAALLAHRVQVAEVKTATPSRAQHRIQVRIAWTDPDGAHGLGYLSMTVQDAESVAVKKTFGPSLHNFFQDVFRTVQWSKKQCRKETGRSSDWGAFEDDLMTELKKLGVMNSNSRIHELHRAAVQAIGDCAGAGKHKTARKERLVKKVKAAISNNIQFAISQGLSDDEIRELVELAFVKHTMEC
jgi:hypothetical protein